MVNMTSAKFLYITLPDNLESFGESAFSFCPELKPELKNVNIPAILKGLGDYLFYESREIFKEQCVEIPALI